MSEAMRSDGAGAVRERVGIVLNGEGRQVPGGYTVLDLLESLELHPGTVVVEKNREILPRASIGEVAVGEGDHFEVVHFVGGG